MAGFNILVVRAWEQDYPENRLYPQLSQEEGQLAALESGDGTNMLSFQASSAFVEHSGEALAQTQGPTLGVVTDCRVIVSCEKFTKGSTWIGAGPGVAVAAGAMAVSAVRARMRRRGKVMVGHLRYEWLSRVGTRKGAVVALEYRNNFILKELKIRTLGGIAPAMAQDIARRAATLRLAQNPDLTAEQRTALEALHQAQVFSPAVKDWQYYVLPGAIELRTRVTA